MMETYVSESLALRVEKMASMKGDVSLYKDMLDVNISETAHIIRKSGLDAISTFCTKESCQLLMTAIDDLSKTACVNVKDARRRIADKLIADNCYKF
jgi:hypothetical protein